MESLGLFAENDRTLRIELDKASPYLPSMLAHVSLLPRYAKSTAPLSTMVHINYKASLKISTF